MNQHYRDTRKIDPTRGATLGDNTPNDADRIEIGPTQLAYAVQVVIGTQVHLVKNEMQALMSATAS